MAKKTYAKLPGRGAGLVSRSTLWEGPDHLLLVTHYMMGESYKRFYYGDIQALVSRRNVNWIVATVLLALLTGFGFYTSWGLRQDDLAWLGLFVIVPFGIALLWNLVLGPSCETWLYTAVQKEKMTSLARERRVRRVLARIGGRIEAAQGALAPEEYREAAALAQIAPAPPREGEKDMAKGAVGLRFHTAAFTLFLAAGAMSGLRWLSAGQGVQTLLTIVGGLAFLALVVALVRQNMVRVPRPVKNMAWAALAVQIILTIAGVTVGAVVGAQMVFSGVDDPNAYARAALSPQSSGLALGLWLATFVGLMGVGGLGLWTVNRHGRKEG